MPLNTTEPSPQDAARMLAWLIEMGADEVHGERAIDRIAQSAENKKAAPVPRPAAAIHGDGTGEAAGLAQSAATLEALVQILDGFDAHPLKKTATRHCFLGGAARSRILVISDRPRNEEDRSGQVFAGKNEVLVERMLAAIDLCGLSAVAGKEQAMLASFIPWRPPGNRSPTDLECRLSAPFIRRAIELAQPDIVLSLGHLAGQYLAGGADAIPKQRGKWMAIAVGDKSVPLISTFHPETLLKSPANKKWAWHDLLALRQKLDEFS